MRFLGLLLYYYYAWKFECYMRCNFIARYVLLSRLLNIFHSIYYHFLHFLVTSFTHPGTNLPFYSLLLSIYSSTPSLSFLPPPSICLTPVLFQPLTYLTSTLSKVNSIPERKTGGVTWELGWPASYPRDCQTKWLSKEWVKGVVSPPEGSEVKWSEVKWTEVKSPMRKHS